MIDLACMVGMVSFRFFSLMTISYRSQKSLFRFEEKQAKLTFWFAAKQIFFSSFFALFRFEAKQAAHPNTQQVAGQCIPPHDAGTLGTSNITDTECFSKVARH